MCLQENLMCGFAIDYVAISRLKVQCDGRKPFKFCCDFIACEIIANILDFIVHVPSIWSAVAHVSV